MTVEGKEARKPSSLKLSTKKIKVVEVDKRIRKFDSTLERIQNLLSYPPQFVDIDLDDLINQIRDRLVILQSRMRGCELLLQEDREEEQEEKEEAIS